MIVSCRSIKVIAPKSFKCIQFTLLNVSSCTIASFLCFRQLQVNNSGKQHSETQEGSNLTRWNIQEMHFKQFGAITLMLQQVTINGWKQLPGPGFGNPSQKTNLGFVCILRQLVENYYCVQHITQNRKNWKISMNIDDKNKHNQTNTS